MIPPPRVRWFAAAAAALAAVGVLHGQKPESSGRVESPAVAPSGPKPEQGATIEVAKKEFDAVKSLREFGPDPKGNLPRLSLPSMPSGAAPSALPSAGNRPELDRQPSKNWLVDAMEKRASEKNSRTADDRETERGREPNELRAGRTRGREDEEKNSRPETPNPFARYLGDWMTPQDLALLKPALENSTRGDSAAGNGALPNLSGEAAVALGDFGPKSALSGASGTNRLPATGQVRENPYLDVLGGARAQTAPPPAVVSRPSGSFGAPQSPASAATAPGVPPPPPQAGKLPEFVRPNADEKYFKQLKRF